MIENRRKGEERKLVDERRTVPVEEGEDSRPPYV
jgi:hypothetical protein